MTQVKGPTKVGPNAWLTVDVSRFYAPAFKREIHRSALSYGVEVSIDDSGGLLYKHLLIMAFGPRSEAYLKAVKEFCNDH